MLCSKFRLQIKTGPHHCNLVIFFSFSRNLEHCRDHIHHNGAAQNKKIGPDHCNLFLFFIYSRHLEHIRVMAAPSWYITRHCRSLHVSAWIVALSSNNIGQWAALQPNLIYTTLALCSHVNKEEVISTNKVTCHNEFICCRSMPWDYNRVHLSNKVDPVPVSASLFTYGKHTVRDLSIRYLMAIVFVGDQCVIHCAFTPAIHTNYMLYHSF